MVDISMSNFGVRIRPQGASANFRLQSYIAENIEGAFAVATEKKLSLWTETKKEKVGSVNNLL